MESGRARQRQECCQELITTIAGLKVSKLGGIQARLILYQGPRSVCGDVVLRHLLIAGAVRGPTSETSESRCVV